MPTHREEPWEHDRRRAAEWKARQPVRRGEDVPVAIGVLGLLMAVAVVWSVVATGVA
jgi:hypothetical protein